MELFGVLLETSVELLWILCLGDVLLLLIDDIFEIIFARIAVSSARVRLNALIVEGVPAHEMNRW
jgi:hypothetical protein|tara:strand:+ start:147 stop:341 length:195 start_codon:yes stop_codon:yes gene_type:complete